MSVQSDIVAILDDALDETFVVSSGPDLPDAGEPGRRYVNVYRTNIDNDGLPAGTLRHQLTIEVLTAHTDDLGRADADLAEATDTVLAVLDHDPDLSGLKWTTADRTVLDERFHAMQISAWCITTDAPTDQE